MKAEVLHQLVKEKLGVVSSKAQGEQKSGSREEERGDGGVALGQNAIR